MQTVLQFRENVDRSYRRGITPTGSAGRQSRHRKENGMEGQKIFQSIAAIMEDVSAISKDKKNAQQGFMFRGIDDVYNELHPLLAKHKVFTVPEVLSSESTFETTSKGGKLFYEKMMIRYTFYADDGSSVQATVKGVGMDSGDKAANKAMAIGHKYALLQVFAIPTKDMVDPDSDTPPDSMDQRLPADHRPPTTGLTARTPTEAAAQLAQRTAQSLAPAQPPAPASQQGPRPTRGNPRRATSPQQPPKTATLVMSALPAGVTPTPAEQGSNDLPWEPEAPAATQPASTFTQKSGCIGQSEYDQIIMGLHAKKIKKLKWLAYIKETYNVDTASALTMEQFKEVFAVIYSNPAAIDPGPNF